MEVIADRNLCIGSGMCVFTAPGTFGQDESAKVVLLSETPGDDIDALRAAVESCPTGALTISDDEGA